MKEKIVLIMKDLYLLTPISIIGLSGNSSTKLYRKCLYKNINTPDLHAEFTGHLYSIISICNFLNGTETSITWNLPFSLLPPYWLPARCIVRICSYSVTYDTRCAHHGHHRTAPYVVTSYNIIQDGFRIWPWS